jgi:outer membrane protein assembly factor BamB
MGPTLWDADLDVFAIFEGGEGSHLDMLHQSPLCMGIAWESGNAYWAFDGLNEHLVRYDFKSDHGPGGSDHSDGSIRRYLNAVVSRREDVPGHMVVDSDTRTLFVADTGTGRVMALDIDSGASNGQLSGNWDGVGDYSGWDGATWEPVAVDFSAPSGLALADGRLFVGDFDTGEIVAIDTGGAELGRVSTGAIGLTGLTIGPEGQLWYVDAIANEVVRIDP